MVRPVLGAQVVALSAYAEVFRGGFGGAAGPTRLRPERARDAREHRRDAGVRRRRRRGDRRDVLVLRRARFSADEALVRVLGFNALFYVAFGVGAWTAALVDGHGCLGRRAGALHGSMARTRAGVRRRAVVVTQPRGSSGRRGRRGSCASTRPRVRDRRNGLGAPSARRSGGRRMLAPRCSTGPAASRACGRRCARSARRFLLPELVLAFAAGHAAMILPLPLGGVGGVDAALTYALTASACRSRSLSSRWASTGCSRSGLRRFPALAALLLVPSRHAARRLEAAPSLR